MQIDFARVLVLVVVLVLFVVVPVLFVRAGIRKIRQTSSRGAWLAVVAGCLIALAPVGLAVAYVVWVGPGRSGIVVEGRSPQGQEYCVVQIYQDLVEPYRVSLFIRDTNAVWRWNYLEHEDVAWRSARVEFTADQARVFRNGELFRAVLLPTGTVDLAAVPSGLRHQYYPAAFTVRDIFESQRSGRGW